MSKAISWQTNGDLSTHCLKAERDVIIPPVTRHNQALHGAYADLAKITPSSQRTQLAFINGKLEGLGTFARTRLAAVDGIVYQASSEKLDYIQQLGKSKFCLLPRGIAGWYAVCHLNSTENGLTDTPTGPRISQMLSIQDASRSSSPTVLHNLSMEFSPITHSP